MDEGGDGHRRSAGERQLALGADHGAVGDHLAAIDEKLSLELGGIGAERAGHGTVFAGVAGIRLNEGHRQE